jgi:hypothetical protein
MNAQLKQSKGSPTSQQGAPAMRVSSGAMA